MAPPYAGAAYPGSSGMAYGYGIANAIDTKANPITTKVWNDVKLRPIFSGL